MNSLTVIKRQVLSFICVLILAVCCFNISASAFYQPTGETKNFSENSGKIGGSGIGYREETVSLTLDSKNRDKFITWHPDFDGYTKADGYFFYTTTASVSTSLGFISYNPACKNGGSGYYVSADGSRWSRPALYGDIYTETYRAGSYNFNTKQWLNYSTKTRDKVQNIYVHVRYR